MDTSHKIIQLMRKVRNRVKKARNCPNACRYHRVPPGVFLGGGGASNSLHTALVVGRGQK